MKKIIKIVLSTILSLSICSNLMITVHADATLDQYIAELIYYHANGAETDELRILDKIKGISSEEYNKWRDVMDYWYWIESDMVENVGVAPDSLPNDSTHAFVVLGFALNNDTGQMEPELIGRLEVAKASALKYPNSYILVTGGVEKHGNTEGDLMHDWLVAEGIDDNRIIVENQSRNTAENALFSFDKLYNNYNVKTVSIITSQYHLKRASILYYTQAMQSAKIYGKTPIEIIGNGNAGWYRSDKTEEPMTSKAYSLSLIAGGDVNANLMSLMQSLPATSILQSIAIKGDKDYILGSPLNIKVTATYDIENYQRDITSLATITGYDPNKLGTQTVSAEYIENNVTKRATFNVKVKAKATTTVNAKAPATGDTTNYAPLTALFTLSLISIVAILKRRQNI
ncbi:hypothetical protein M2475_000525 [Breznakia sp. PF5-3]|uniref:YdcF family protein n=1 Tax=unclassified Breznakia TaxID=2623764 RepID=UPI0024062D7C|nr:MULTISPECIES: YdcF family protein [unclassified Breznakia]MDF9824175.1 hypothetical protein [Breznakia sp. PM6-1]MDF9834973.1 hypothetical protein [Breznakia sp. PF5-3]MDF9837158.1 hypothetical protein [Breznakia sp. PFB2-8]MDF9859148.1 hypothetical protein [Breznakia sp. PH5-24]